MGNFRYIAVDQKGKRSEGTLGGFTREEVSAELLELKDAVVWDEAENRMHSQKALLEYLLNF